MYPLFRAVIAIVLLCSTVPLFAIDVNLRGTIKDNSGNGLSGATITLLKAGLSATSTTGGAFAVTGTVPDIGTRWKGKMNTPSTSTPSYSGGVLSFRIPERPQQVTVDLYDIRGKHLGTVLSDRLIEGSYSIAPLAMLKGAQSSMLYLLRVRIGNDIATFMAPRTTRQRPAQPAVVRTTTAADLKKSSAGAVDTMEITLCGYLLHRHPIESYSQSGMTVTMAQGTLDTATERRIDSLFNSLRRQIESLDSLDSPDQLKTKDFASIRDGFNDVLTGKDSYHMKATIGYIVSSVLSLNANESFWRLVDSLDAYISAVEGTPRAHLSRTAARPKAMLKKSLVSGGVTNLGKTMAAVSWRALALSGAEPSFPKFITLSYIQSIAENDVVPVLTNVIAACNRMESCGNRSLFVDIEGDTFEIDKGEIHLLDAQMRLLRAGLNGFCMYDMNMYNTTSDDYTWIDSLRRRESKYWSIYSLSGDTLKTLRMFDNSAPMSFVARLARHNMQRPGYMTQRRAFGQMVKRDLLAVPATIKSGIAYIRAETDNQSDDILKISDLMKADRDLVDVPQRMIDNGVSPALANKFRSPESIADFVTELLSGPYTFDETTTEGHRINITVNLTAMLDSPVHDLKTLLPKYDWLPEQEWVIRTETYRDGWATNYNSFSLYPGDSLAIPASAIAEIDSDMVDYKIVYLQSNYHYEQWVDSSIDVNPICLLDDQGNRIAFDDIADMIDAKTFFPYFNDYTMGGVFPGMTRQKWLDLIYQK